MSVVTRYKRPLIWIAVILILALIFWFVFREVKSIQSESNAERELLLRQRKAAESALEKRDSLARHIEDSLLMEILGIKTRVEFKIIERERWITKYIDTASNRTKFLYMDSLFGPKY